MKGSLPSAEWGPIRLIFRVLQCSSKSWRCLYDAILLVQAESEGPGSIPDNVIGRFNRPSASNHTLALGSTQPLTEMTTWSLPRGKGRSAVA
jgi:hypothetical protein